MMTTDQDEIFLAGLLLAWYIQSPLLLERCPPRQKSRVERLKAKVKPLLTQVTVETCPGQGTVARGESRVQGLGFQDVCKGARFPVEGERCVISIRPPYKRLQVNEEEGDGVWGAGPYLVPKREEKFGGDQAPENAAPVPHVLCCSPPACYRDTSLIRNSANLATCSRTMPRAP